MFVGPGRGDTPAGRARQETLLDQVGLQDVFDGAPLLTQGRRQALHAHRASLEILDDDLEQTPVQPIKTPVIHLEHLHGLARDVEGDAPVGLDLGVVTHASEQPVGDTRRAARAPGDLRRPIVVNVHLHDGSGTAHDDAQFIVGIELQPLHDAETIPQGRSQKTGAGGGADESEGGQIQPDGSRRRTFPDHDVELEILEGRIQDFFDDRGQAMDLVHEQHVPGLQIGEQGRQITGTFQHRSGGLPEPHVQFVGDHMGQRSLAQSRRPENEHVVQRVAAAPGGFNEDLHLLAHRLLPHVLVQGFGTQGRLQSHLFRTRL